MSETAKGCGQGCGVGMGLVFGGIAAIVAVIIICAGFASVVPEKPDETDAVPKDGEPSTSQAATTLIPYEVIKREEYLHYKISFDLRVDLVEERLPTKEELGAVSNHLKSEKHDKTFVLFYLPGMTVDTGAFASAHHEPDLEVNILRDSIPDKYKYLLPSE